MDWQLIRSLKELSGQVDEREACDAKIAKLREKRNGLTTRESQVHVEEKSANQAADVLQNARTKAEAKIRTIKTMVWVVAIAAIVFSGVNMIPCLTRGGELVLTMVMSTLIAAGIAAFCFYRIAEGEGGCLSWIFGIGCAVEVLAYGGMAMAQGGLPVILFFVCLIAGVLAIVMLAKWDGWQDGVMERCESRAKATEEYRTAENNDEEVRYQNRVRRERAVSARRWETERERASIDAQLAELQSKRNKVDAALRANTVFPYRDLDKIDRVIEILESYRADTLSEALRVYDDQEYRRNMIVKAQFDERMRQLDQKWQRQDRFERDMAEAAHRRRMEELEQKQLEALEEERRANEYYRRYGK